MDLKKELKRLNNLEILKAVYKSIGGYDSSIDTIDKVISTILTWMGDEIMGKDDHIIIKIKRYEVKK